MSRAMVAILAGAALIAPGACSAPGLPPAGPGPDEVDVGYGTKEEGEVTGAVSSVKGKEIGAAQPQGIIEVLRARVPGLQVMQRAGRGVRLRIRGTNSLLADVDPLFVIDGVQMSDVDAALAGLNPNDIRQVDVLKDVASTSIYGVRGAGGVILITTRR